MRLIDADELKHHKFLTPDAVEAKKWLPAETKGYQLGWNDAIDAIVDNAPTVEITEEQAIDKLHETGWLPRHDKEMTERPTGHWIIEECSLGKTYYCSECYAHPEVCFDFCPYCGADMRGDRE